MFAVAPERPLRRPWAFLVTFACYGARLHGNDRGSVDRHHNFPDGRYIPAARYWEAYERRIMLEPPFELDHARRAVVLQAIRETCSNAGWRLHAAHVRSNHVHVVVDAEATRDRLLARLKGRASHDLRKMDPVRKRRWARHGSVRELWTPRSVDEAVEYVVKGQGEPLAVWENRRRWEEGAAGAGPGGPAGT